MLSEKILGDPCWPLGQNLTGLFQPELGGGQLFGRTIITEWTIIYFSYFLTEISFTEVIKIFSKLPIF